MTDSKAIRRELKETLGYNARQVSVKIRHYSQIIFTIRDKNISISDIKEFASKFENIHYCEYTQEILSGGNTFTDVYYSEEVKKELAAEKIEAVKSALAKVEDDRHLEQIEGTELWIGKDYMGISIWGESTKIGTFHNEECASIAVAIA